jgi:hypothetical protein
LLNDDGPPQVFSAEIVAGLLRGAREDKISIADMEKQLDDMSVQCDENDRLVGENEELLKVIGVPARGTAAGGEEKDAASQLMEVVVALANEVRDLKEKTGEASASIVRPRNDS